MSYKSKYSIIASLALLETLQCQVKDTVACPGHPATYQNDPMSSKTPTPDFVDGGILTGKMTFLKDECLAKLVCILD